MVVYEYPIQEDQEVDPQVIVGKVNSILQSTMVLRSISTGLTIVLDMTRELTVSEKTAIDALMADPTVGILPSPAGYTIFQMDSLYQKLMELRATIPEIEYVFNVSDGAQIWINGTLSPQDQNKLRGALSSLLREVL